MERDGFIFYRSFWDGIKNLPEEVKIDVITCIMEYALNGVEVDTDNKISKSVFTLIKPQIDANNKKYENGKKGGRPNNQTKTKTKPNDNQEITTEKPNDNQTETEVEPKEKDKVKEKEKEKDNDKDKEEIDSNVPSGEETSPRVNYKEIVDKYNSILGGKLPKVQSLTEKRKKAIRARISEHGIESIDKVLENVLKSRFLTGYNNRGWSADFDWIFCPSNYVKILEGNYNDLVKSGFNPEVGRILTDNSQKKYEKGW